MTAAEEHLVAELAEAARGFIVAAVGENMGAGMTEQAKDLADTLLPVVLADRRRAVTEALREAAKRESDTIADTVLALADDFIAENSTEDDIAEVDADAVYDWLIRQAAEIRRARADAVEAGGR